MMRGSYTEEETAIARELIARRASDAECMAALGRSRNTLMARMAYHDDPNRREIVKARAAKFSKSRARKRNKDAPDYGAYEYRSRPEYEFKIPAPLLADAATRQSAPRPLTAWICGDPPPGYSALDKKQGASA